MDNEQIQSLISQLKGVGLSDEEILDVFYAAFEKGKMDRKDLETLADSLGYELADDFKEDKTPDPIAAGGDAAGADIEKSDAEDLKEIEPGESPEEFKEKVDEAKDDIEIADEDEEPSEDDGEDADEEDAGEDEEVEEDDEEWEEAKKYFKI